MSASKDIIKCLETRSDVGYYKWLPDTHSFPVSGVTLRQDVLVPMFKRQGSKTLACELVREPTNKHDKRAIAVYVAEQKIGYCLEQELDYWHRLFDRVGGASTRLVGTVVLEKQDRIFARATIQVITKID